jgi:hypothetical protein
MPNKTELKIYTDAAIAGYEADPQAKCPHLYSSAMYLVWIAGRWMKATGRSRPTQCWPSRGYHVRINDLTIKWSVGNHSPNSNFERVS